MKHPHHPSHHNHAKPSEPPQAFSRRQFLVAAGAVAAGATVAPALAVTARETYSDSVMSHAALRGYWRFDGSLADAKGKASAKAQGIPTFLEGAVKGKALSLTPDQTVAVPDIKHLRSESATVELFFKLNAQPSGKANPVIISQASGKKTRFVIGVRHDLAGLTFFEGRVPTTITLPGDAAVEVGRWYHLAVTSNPLDIRVYVDGHECVLTGGALDFTRSRQPGVIPMTFGAIAGGQQVTTPISLDEVAYYAFGLSLGDIRGHLLAGGWGDRVAEVGRSVERLKTRQEAARDQKLTSLLHDKALTERGESRIYRGEHLDAISFTVGGVGAGGIQFDGHARPAIWQLACNLTQASVADSFLALRVQREGKQPAIRALQTKRVGSFEAMSSLSCQGEYPFATYRFDDPVSGVLCELEVFNPFVPMDAKRSGIPCAIYTVKTTNSSKEPVRVHVLASQKNALGYEHSPQGKYGGNSNRVVRDGNATLLHMTRKAAKGAAADMVLMTSAQGASGLAEWGTNASLHRTFAAHGDLPANDAAGPSGAGKTINGALSVPLELAPGESKSVTYALAWSFPGVQHGQPRGAWKRTGNMYSNWWPHAMGVAQFLRDHLDDLTVRTRRFHAALYASNLPVWLLDRLSSQLAVLRSQTCWWSADGYFGAWEGCASSKGCCGGNCTHVWHYAQAHARLLPELGRRMREQDFAWQHEDGLTPFRHLHARAAADGHFGTVLNAYREHLCSVDDGWLKQVWPKVKKAMDWGIKAWDPDRNGYLQNIQHNTLDGEMAGCSSWIGTLYLTALEASARMAEQLGDAALASSYRAIRTSGMQLQNERLWNGEYYIQAVGKERTEDYLDGCHIDQILGEWWADQIGIDRNYPQERAGKAMGALLKYNFLADFHGQSLKPRQFVTADDAGMKMITWPKGPQPIPGMKYGDEVMTGFEYGAGVSMIQNGMLREGLMVIKAIYDRYDGRMRKAGITKMDTGAWGYTGNPFGDDECGKFYGRSLSVWSALLALQGFSYDGPAGKIGFKPRWKPEDHASFFTGAEGYGLFSQQRDRGQLTASIDLREGRLTLREMELALEEAKRPKAVEVKVAGQSIGVTFELNGGGLRLVFQQPVTLVAGDRLDVRVAFA